jgi:hypothetical protein
MIRAALVFSTLFCCVPVSAQEFRASITGRAMDQSGAVIPNASIIVTSTETGAKVDTKSDQSGVYTVPFLLPGTYSISASMPGFQNYLHSGIKLETGAKVTEDITLTIGNTEAQVVVTSAAPLIQTATATAGQVLSTEEIENLPANGRSPLAFAKLEYGVVAKQKNSVTQARPFDNSAASDFSIGGGNSQSNEILLNGVPNMQNSARVSAYSPLQDSVAEIRVDVFGADASYGDTSGGTVNMTTKAGTNTFHGALSEFNQFSGVNAAAHWFVPPTVSPPVTRQNQYGGTLGGPVSIPGAFDGHDRLFFFYAYEGFKGSQPGKTTTTVPTAAERQGDFSALLALGPSYQLYDPATATGTTTITRQKLGNNVIPQNRLNPVALAYLRFYPLPNLPGAADGENNFFSNTPTIYDYNSNQGRLDYSFNNSNKLFFEVHRSNEITTQSNVFKNIATGNLSVANYWGGLLDYVRVLSPTLTLDGRVGLSRSYLNNTLPSAGFDATQLGFPSYINTLSTERALPRITFSEPGTAFAGLSTAPGTNAVFDTVQYFAEATKVTGNHTIKIGPDIRANTSFNTAPGFSSGSFGFSSTYMSAGTGAPGPAFGSSFASFLLGLPTSGSYNVSTPTTSTNWYFSGFIQDDWKALPHLTLNIGLRLEHETPIVERDNKAVVGFDPTVTNAITAAAMANYAAHPSPILPASAFAPTGGISYATPDHRNAYNTPALYASPRLGVAFAPPTFHDTMAIRGGLGIFVNPFNDYNTSQTYGYSQSTSLVPSNDNSRTPSATLTDPFPATNPIQLPAGSSLGINTNIGNGVQFVDPNVKVPYSIRWNVDVQQQLSPNMMIDVGYIGNRQEHLSYSNTVSAIPLLSWLSRSPKRDGALTTLMGTGIANPFLGLLGSTSYGTNATLTNAQLLQAYPEYTSLVQALVPGASARFHEFLFRFQKRMSSGLMMNVNYEWSHSTLTNQLNPGGPLTYGGTTSDFPNHLAVTAMYKLPFGRSGSVFSNANRGVDLLIGGFTVSAIYQYLSGALLQWGSLQNPQPIFANGTNAEPRLSISPRNTHAAFDTSLFDRAAADQPNSFNYRTFPAYFGRQDATNNLDISVMKEFRVGERVRIQYRFDAFNALNHVQFGAPNLSPTSSAFGTITSQANVPRVLQQGLRVVF